MNPDRLKPVLHVPDRLKPLLLSEDEPPGRQLYEKHGEPGA